ncbi:MAG TPA: multiubiquitin domain-containing protein [Candidatus Baltobacteraceae bacterium]|nr:multiubiquitin domain-containing protein [Candidatus Baltobacteraceae bacterium]
MDEMHDGKEAELEGELRELDRAIAEDMERLEQDEARKAEIEQEMERRPIVIFVNTRERRIEARSISYDELVRLAFDPAPSGPNIAFTITYRRGPHEHPEGIVAPGQTVRIKEGEIFNVTRTDRS